VDVAMAQGGKPRDICSRDGEAFLLSVFERRLHVERIPQDNGIHDSSQRPQVILLPRTVPLSKRAALAMKDRPSDTVAGFAPVELGENPPPIVLIINVRQHVEGFGNAPERGDGPASVEGRLLLRMERISSGTHHALMEEPATRNKSSSCG
jgi:hypothetical protein